MLRLKSGDCVRICGETTWANCVVEDIRPVTELPRIAGAPDVGDVAGILAEGGCTATAIFSFEDRGKTTVFAALLIGDVWRDLKGRPLTIAIRNQAA